ncbi:MAG: beta-ketoacyl synthase N-terminal-like domain-containing protein [Nitrospirota bacterium]
MNAVIVACDMVTAYGTGIDACWNGIAAGKSAITPVTRFGTRTFQSSYAGIVPGLLYHQASSLVMQMLVSLFSRSSGIIPPDAMLLLATTKGEIDFLEMNILNDAADAAESSLKRLLEKTTELTKVTGMGMVFSSACTSSSAALGYAAALIQSGKTDCILVVACDSVTEFIFSGFSSLMALDAVPARPFDKNRSGLNVGEAAAYAVLMSTDRAAREQRHLLGRIAGWGMSDDANHMTGPSRDSEGMIIAIQKALQSAGMDSKTIGFIAAHGTGTLYNDAMEMRAFHAVFSDQVLPVYSIKGGIGHTMGAAGLVEMIIALKAQREKKIPPTVNLTVPDTDAAGWASGTSQTLDQRTTALITNAGFSGVNTALILAEQ